MGDLRLIWNSKVQVRSGMKNECDDKINKVVTYALLEKGTMQTQP